MRKKKKGLPGFVRILLKLSALFLCLAGLFVFAVFAGVFGHLQTPDDLREYRNATASVVLSDNGRPIGKFFHENRTNISSGEIPGHLSDALIATEDIRFSEHRGIDTRSLLRVFFKSVLLRDRTSGGGSTITQQLAKNMFGRRSYGFLTLPVNKTREIILAVRLEKAFTKDEILTLYLNTVSFGENVYGIEAAAGRFFGKKTAALEIQEAAVLVGMLKANTLYNPRLNPENSLQRRNVVIRQMVKYSFLDSAEADSICNLPLVSVYNNYESSGPADYFLVQVRNEAESILHNLEKENGEGWDLEKDGLIISTTLDLALQNNATAAFREHLPLMQRRLREQYRSGSGRKALEAIAASELERSGLAGRAGKQVVQRVFDWDGPYTDTLSVRDSIINALTILHAGLLAIDPVSGDVKAWVGGIDFKSQPYDQVLARRQLASVFKPVLYSAALEDGMEPCQYLDNDSVTLAGLDTWTPENYDHSYGGRYSLAGALAQSMNVPTFSLYMLTGFEKVNALWKALGFSFPLDNTPSLALGTGEASIREVAEAYSAFANGGFRTGIRMISSIKAPDGQIIFARQDESRGERVITERTSLLMSAMLQKAIREGTGISITTRYGLDIPLAGKTGTSQNYSDAWFAAFTPGIVIVTRAGASTRAVHFSNGSYGSGSALALPLAALTLKKTAAGKTLSERYLSPFPPLPPELASALDCPDFREKSFFDEIIDVFQPRRTRREDPQSTEKRIRSLIERIFRR